MNRIRINQKISYIECGEEPLSADIGIIEETGHTWLFDVGCGRESLSFLNSHYDGVILSHFHKDHIGNINDVDADIIYASKETCQYIENGTIVNQELTIGNLRIFPLPSSHAKGCLGLEIDKTYAFVGDGLYCRVKDGFYVYNAQLLKEEIEVLQQLSSPYLLVSHFKGLVRSREEVVEELKEIYSRKTKNSSEIHVPIEKH